MEEGKKKIVSQVVLFVVVFTIAFFGTKYVMKSFNSGNSELQKEVVELNKECPKLIDSETRLDSANTFDNTIQYHYTLINIEKANSDVNIAELKEFAISQSQTNLDTNPGMKNLKEKAVSLKYNYKDKTGKALFDFTIKPTKK